MGKLIIKKKAEVVAEYNLIELPEKFTIGSGPDDTIAVTMDSTTTIDVLANDSDPNGDPLSIIEIIDPQNGTAIIMPGDTLISYTPQTGYTGLDSLQYVITDGEFFDTAKVIVTVALMKSANLDNLNLQILDFQMTSSTIPITITMEQLLYGFGERKEGCFRRSSTNDCRSNRK